jgi:prevent-host-death family protein
MKNVGAFEAKTHLNEILRKVSQGESFRITRRGVPIARLIPDADGGTKDLKKIAQEIREIRKGANLGGLTYRELIDEGRRY